MKNSKRFLLIFSLFFIFPLAAENSLPRGFKDIQLGMNVDEAKEFSTLEELKKKELIEKFERNAEEKKETLYIKVTERPNRDKKEIDINAL